jgi:hypothetical protein
MASPSLSRRRGGFVFALPRRIELKASGETTVRGYRVKRRYQPVSPEGAELRKQAIAQVLGGRAKGRRERT